MPQHWQTYSIYWYEQAPVGQLVPSNFQDVWLILCVCFISVGWDVFSKIACGCSAFCVTVLHVPIFLCILFLFLYLLLHLPIFVLMCLCPSLFFHLFLHTTLHSMGMGRHGHACMPYPPTWQAEETQMGGPCCLCLILTHHCLCFFYFLLHCFSAFCSV